MSKPSIRLGVVGSRSFDRYPVLKQELDKLLSQSHSQSQSQSQIHIEMVVSGGAAGADRLAERWAEENHIPTTIYKPDWKKYGKAAGLMRNREIVNDSDLVIAFWNGWSKGTASSIDLAKEMGKGLIIKYI